MTFEEIRERIPEYLSGRLVPAEKSAFEAELNASAELRIEVEELRYLWQEMGSLPEEQPSAALRARFYQKLSAAGNDRRGIPGGFAWWKPGLRGLVWQSTLAAAIFVLGMYAGHLAPGGHASEQEVAHLGTEVQNLRQTVALSMLGKRSPASRLEGIAWSSRIQHPDGDLVSALLNTFEGDPNVNVRLSALDALEKFDGDPGVRKALLDSLPHQNSPLVQIALIDAIVHMHDNGAARELRKLSGNTDANAAVRERAQWDLERLSYQ
ncbi:MAG: HEAT repeat domain-containing protein [Bryobacteraceae bacterium]